MILPLCPFCKTRLVAERAGAKGRKPQTCKHPECERALKARQNDLRVARIRAGEHVPVSPVRDKELAERFKLMKSLTLPHFALRNMGEGWLGGYRLDIQLGGGMVEPASVHIQTRKMALAYAGELEQVAARLREWGKSKHRKSQ